MAVIRKTRILLSVLLIFIVLFTTRHYDYLPRTPSWPSTNNPDYNIPLEDMDEAGGSSPDEPPAHPLAHTGYSPVEPELVAEAHKLPSADTFLAHFQAVTRLPNMTMAEAKAPCIWPEGTKVNFQYGTGQEWVNTDRPDSEIAERRKQWQEFVDTSMVPYSHVKNKFLGRGVVIVAGNQDTLKRLRVILLALIRLNSTIGVEIAYWGDEMNNATKVELGALYFHTFFLDLSLPTNILNIEKNGIYINYQLKTAAVLNSRFAEPLLIDSDNIPVIDPLTLYDSAVYREHGSVFWPDIARTRPQNPAWALTNTQCRRDEYEQESGQLMVDKRKYFYHLQLAAWLNNDASQRAYWGEFLLGDKDMFRFAWHALKTRYGRPARWLASVGVQNDGFYCGHTFAQHHPDPDGGVAFMHGGLVKTTDLETIRWNRDTQGGIFRHYKRAQYDMDPEKSIDVGIKFDGAVYLPEHSEGFHGASCTDMFGVDAHPLDELVPGFEETFRHNHGYWMLDEEDKQKSGDEGDGEDEEEPE